MGSIPDDQFYIPEENKPKAAPEVPVRKTSEITDDDFYVIPKEHMPSTGTATLYGIGRNIAPSIAGIFSGAVGGIGGAAASGGSPLAAYTVPTAAFAASAAGAAGTAKVQEMIWKPGLREQIAASDSPNAYSWGGMIPGFATGRPVGLKDFATKAGRTQMAVEAGSEFGGDLIINGILGDQQNYGQSAGQAAFEALLQGHQTRIGSAISNAPINLAQYLTSPSVPKPATPITPGTQQQILAEARGAQDIVPPTGPETPVVPAASQPQVVPTVTQGQAAPVVATPAATATPAVATPAATTVSTPAAPAAPAATATPAAPVAKPSVQPGTTAAVSVGQDGRGQVTHVPDHIPAHETLAPEQLRAAHAAMEPAQAANSIIGLNAEAHRRSHGLDKKPAEPAFVERILTHTGTALRDLSTRDQGLAISTGEGISRLLERHIATAKSNPDLTPYTQDNIFEMEYRKARIDAIVDHIRKGGREPLPYSVAGAAAYVKNMKYYAGKDAEVEVSRNTPPTPEQAQAESEIDIQEVPVKFSTRKFVPNPDKTRTDGTSVLEDGEAPIVEYTAPGNPGRLMVIRNINGVQVPFYLSTGSAGKKDVPPGKWYPFFGIKDSWINKTGGEDMANYQNRKELAAVARQLDRTIGDIRHKADRDLFPKIGNREAIVHVNQGFDPAGSGDADVRAKVDANIKNLFDRLDAAAAQRKPKPAQPTPTAQSKPDADATPRKGENFEVTVGKNDNGETAVYIKHKVAMHNGKEVKVIENTVSNVAVDQTMTEEQHVKYAKEKMARESIASANKADAEASSIENKIKQESDPERKAYLGGILATHRKNAELKRALAAELRGEASSKPTPKPAESNKHEAKLKDAGYTKSGDGYIDPTGSYKITQEGKKLVVTNLKDTFDMQGAPFYKAGEEIEFSGGRRNVSDVENLISQLKSWTDRAEKTKPATPVSTELAAEVAKPTPKPATPKPSKPAKPLTKKEQRAAEKKAEREKENKAATERQMKWWQEENPNAGQDVIDAYRMIIEREHGEPASEELKAAYKKVDEFEISNNENAKKVVSHPGVERYERTVFDEDGVVESGSVIHLKEGYTLDVGPDSGYQFKSFPRDDDGNFEGRSFHVNNDADAEWHLDTIIKKSDLPEITARRKVERAEEEVNSWKNAMASVRAKIEKLRSSKKKEDIDFVTRAEAGRSNAEQELKDREQEASDLKSDYESKFGKYEKKVQEPEPEGRDPAEEEPDPDEDPEDVAEREALWEESNAQNESEAEQREAAKTDRQIYEEQMAEQKRDFKKGSAKEIQSAEKRLKDAETQLDKANESGKVKPAQIEKLISAVQKAKDELEYLTNPGHNHPAFRWFLKMNAIGFKMDRNSGLRITSQTSFTDPTGKFSIWPSLKPKGGIDSYGVAEIDMSGEYRQFKDTKFFKTVDEALNHIAKKTGGEAASGSATIGSGMRLGDDYPKEALDLGFTVEYGKDFNTLVSEGGFSVFPYTGAYNYGEKSYSETKKGDVIHTWSVHSAYDAEDPSNNISETFNSLKEALDFVAKQEAKDEGAETTGSVEPSVIGDEFPKSVYDMGYSDTDYANTIESPDGYAIGPDWDSLDDLKAGKKIKGWKVVDADEEVIGTYKTLNEALDAVSELDENLEVKNEASEDEVSEEGEKSKETPYRIIGEGWVSERRYLDYLIEVMDWSESGYGGEAVKKSDRKLRNELAKKLGVNIKERAKQMEEEKQASKQANEGKPQQLGGGVQKGELFDSSEDFSLAGETAASPPTEKTADTTGDFSTGAEPVHIVAAREQLSKLEKSGRNPDQQAALRKTIAEYNESVRPKSENPNLKVTKLLIELDKIVGNKNEEHRFYDSWQINTIVNKIVQLREAGASLSDILNKFGLKRGSTADATEIEHHYYNSKERLPEPSLDKPAPGQDERVFSDELKQTMRGLQFKQEIGFDKKPVFKSPDGFTEIWPSTDASGKISGWNTREWRKKGVYKFKTLDEAMATTKYADKSGPTAGKNGERNKGRIDFEGFEYPPEDHASRVAYFKEMVETGLKRRNKNKGKEDKVTIEQTIASLADFGKAFPDYREPGGLNHKAMLAIKEAFGFPADHRFESRRYDTERELKSSLDPRHFKPRVKDAEEVRAEGYRERVENDVVAKGILDHDYTARGQGNLILIRPTAEIAEEMNVGIKNVSRLMQQLVREKILSASKGTKVNTANGSYTTTYSLEKGVSVEKFQARLREIAGEKAKKDATEAEPLEIKGKKGLAMAINRQKTLVEEAPNEATKALREKDLKRMQDMIEATKEKYTDNARIETVRRKIKELINENVFKGRNGGLDFIDSSKARDLMDRLKSYESKVGTVEQQAEAVAKPFGENEPADISQARKDLSAIIRNMSRGEGWNAKRAAAEAKIEQFELESKLLSGNYEPTAQDLEIISNTALEEFVAKFGSDDVDPAITSIVEAELASRFEAQERSGIEDTTAGDTPSQKGDLLADIKNLIAEHGAKFGIPTLPKEFGAEGLSVLREQLSKGQVMALMRNPVGMGKIDVERAKTDATYRKEMKDRAEGQLSDLATALSELGWTQFDPANFNSDDLVQAIVAAGKGEMLTPKGGVLGVAAPVDMQAAGIIKRLYEMDKANPDDPFSRRDLSPDAAKRELERRQAQNAKNRAGDPEARKGYAGIVSRVTDEMRLRGDLTPKEIEGVTRIMNKIGAQFFEGVKMKVGAGSRPGEYGQYQTVERIITIFKDAIRNGKFEETAAHEIAHHIARFLPEADRQAVIAELHSKRGEFLKRNKGLENLFSATDRRDWAKKRFTAQQIANANLQDPTSQIVKLDAEELKKEGYKPNESIYRLKLTDETYRLTNPNEYFAEEFKDNVMRELNSDPVYLGRSRNWKEKLAGLWQDIKLNFRKMFGKEIANKILSNFAKGRYNPDEEGSADITGIGSDRQWDGGTTFNRKDRELKAKRIVKGPDNDANSLYPIGEQFVRPEEDGTTVANILGRNKMTKERARQIEEFVKDSTVKHALYRGQNNAYETLDANSSTDGLFHIAADPDYAVQYAQDFNKKLPKVGTSGAVAQVYINVKNVVDISDIGHSIDSRAKIQEMRKLDNDGLSANEHIAAREDEFINKIISEVQRINEGKDIDLTELREGLIEAFDEARDDHLNKFQTSIWQVFSHQSVHSLFNKYGVDAIKYSDSDLRTAQGGKKGGQESYVLADPRRIKAAFGGNDVNPSSSNIFQSKGEPKQSELDMRVSGEVRLQDAMGVAKKNKLTEAEFERLASQDPSFNQREWQSVMEEGHFTNNGPDARLKGARVYKRIALPSMVDPSAEVTAQDSLPKGDVSNSGNGQVFKSVRDASTDQSEDPEVFKNPRSGESVARSAWDIVSGRFFSGMSGKAHQNAKRHPYSDAVKVIANMIHSRPGTKSNAYERDLPTAISTARSKYHTRLNKIMEPLRGMLGGFKDTDQGTAKQQREEVYQALNDMITGRKNITSGAIGEAAAGLKALLSEIHDYRTAAGESIGTVADYYPAVYDSPRIGDNRKDFIKDAKKAYEIQLGEMDEDTLRRELGLTKKEYEEMAENDPDKLEEMMDELTEQKALGLYNSHVRGAGAEEFDSIFGMANKSGAENPSMKRKFSRASQDIMRKWQVNDPFRVVGRYITSGVKRAEIVRRFGNEGEKWKKLSTQMEKDGVPYEVISEMRELTRGAAGIGIPPRGKAGQTFVDTVTLATAASAMGRGFLNNLVEPVTIGMRTGNPLDILRAYAETWTRFLRELPGLSPTLRAKMGETFWSQYGHEIGTIHNSIEDAWMTTHSMELDAEYADPRFRWLTNRVYKANLMDATETAKQQASHAIGFSYINRLAAMARGDHWTAKLGMNAKQSVADQLSELGIAPEKQSEFVEWAKKLQDAKDSEAMALMLGQDEMAKLHQEAMVRFSMQSSVRSNRAHKPEFQDNPLGKAFLQLMNFSYSYAAEVNSRMYDMAKQSLAFSPEGKNYTAYDRIRMMGPVAGGLLSILAYRGLLELKDLLYPSESSKQRAKDPEVVKWVNATSYAGLLGPKFEQMVKSIKRDQAVGGPVGQMAVNVGRAGKAVLESAAEGKDMSAAKKSIAKASVPLLKGGIVAGASAINPALGTVATQATNAPAFTNAIVPQDGKKSGGLTPDVFRLK